VRSAAIQILTGHVPALGLRAGAGQAFQLDRQVGSPTQFVSQASHEEKVAP
jgi:hypothetical protein